jgi:hypothetical protein
MSFSDILDALEVMPWTTASAKLDSRREKTSWLQFTF